MVHLQPHGNSTIRLVNLRRADVTTPNIMYFLFDLCCRTSGSEVMNFFSHCLSPSFLNTFHENYFKQYGCRKKLQQISAPIFFILYLLIICCIFISTLSAVLEAKQKTTSSKSPNVVAFKNSQKFTQFSE